VAEKTEDMIEKLFEKGSIGPATRMVLANAVYFKGDWENKFKEKMTRDDKFFPQEDKPIKVQMMYQKDKFKYSETESVQILDLPYKDNLLSMIIVLPKKGIKISKIEKNLSNEKLKQWISRLRKEETKVFVPRFKLKFKKQVGKVLQKMGMKNAFDSKLADFSCIDGRKHWLYIDSVIHEAVVKVNEKGTEAAAATGVSFVGVAYTEPKIFRADHPFIFIIKDNKTDSILFMGRVVKPHPISNQ